MEIKEHLSWKSKWVIEKYASDEMFKKGIPSEIVELSGNVGLNEGIAELLDIGCGLGAPTAFDHDHAYLGVGSDATEASASQTGLLAATDKEYVAMEDNYPARSNQSVSWRSVFGTSAGNFAWNEFTVANGSSNSAKNLNRYVPATSPGTKGAGSTWTLTLTITMS
jgi:hypothetical protein